MIPQVLAGCGIPGIHPLRLSFENIGEQLRRKRRPDHLGPRKDRLIRERIVGVLFDEQAHPPQRPIPQPGIQPELFLLPQHPLVGKLLGQENRLRPRADLPAQEQTDHPLSRLGRQPLQRLFHRKIHHAGAAKLPRLRPLQADHPADAGMAAVQEAVLGGQFGVQGEFRGQGGRSSSARLSIPAASSNMVKGTPLSRR